MTRRPTVLAVGALVCSAALASALHAGRFGGAAGPSTGLHTGEARLVLDWVARHREGRDLIVWASSGSFADDPLEVRLAVAAPCLALDVSERHQMELDASPRSTWDASHGPWGLFGEVSRIPRLFPLPEGVRLAAVAPDSADMRHLGTPRAPASAAPRELIAMHEVSRIRDFRRGCGPVTFITHGPRPHVDALTRLLGNEAVRLDIEVGYTGLDLAPGEHPTGWASWYTGEVVSPAHLRVEHGVRAEGRVRIGHADGPRR